MAEAVVVVVAMVAAAVAMAAMTMEVVQEEVGVVGAVVLPEDVPPQEEVRHEGVDEEEEHLLPVRPLSLTIRILVRGESYSVYTRHLLIARY